MEDIKNKQYAMSKRSPMARLMLNKSVEDDSGYHIIKSTDLANVQINIDSVSIEADAFGNNTERRPYLFISGKITGLSGELGGDKKKRNLFVSEKDIPTVTMRYHFTNDELCELINKGLYDYDNYDQVLSTEMLSNQPGLLIDKDDDMSEQKYNFSFDSDVEVSTFIDDERDFLEICFVDFDKFYETIDIDNEVSDIDIYDIASRVYSRLDENYEYEGSGIEVIEDENFNMNEFDNFFKEGELADDTNLYPDEYTEEKDAFDEEIKSDFNEKVDDVTESDLIEKKEEKRLYEDTDTQTLVDMRKELIKNLVEDNLSDVSTASASLDDINQELAIREIAKNEKAEDGKSESADNGKSIYEKDDISFEIDDDEKVIDDEDIFIE